MSVSKQPADVVPTGEAVSPLVPKGAASGLLFYQFRRRRGDTRVITEEVVCQAHYDKFSQPGRDMAPLSDREQGVYEQTVRPYTGERPCAACADEAERKAS